MEADQPHWAIEFDELRAQQRRPGGPDPERWLRALGLPDGCSAEGAGLPQMMGVFPKDERPSEESRSHAAPSRA